MWNRTDKIDNDRDDFRYLEISAVGLQNDNYELERVPIVEAPSRARMILRAGDIVVSTTRPHRGAIARIRDEDAGAIASTGFAILRNPDTTRVSRGYLLNTLLSNCVLSQMLQRSSGGAYPAITPDEIDKIRIPLLFDMRKQTRLVKDLDAALIERREKLKQADAILLRINDSIIKALNLMPPPTDKHQAYAVRRRDIFASRCDPLFHAPHVRRAAAILAASPLTKMPVGKLSPDLAGGATPTRGNQELYANDGIKFLRIMNIAPFEILLDDVKYITEDVHKQMLGRSQIRAGDILMTITGRVGTAAVVPLEVLPANINQHIVRIRLVNDFVTPEYLVAYLNSSLGLALTNRGVTGGTRIALDYRTVREMLIPIPDKTIQKNIADEVIRRRKEARQLRKEAQIIWDTAKLHFEEEILGSVAVNGATKIGHDKGGA